MKLYNIRVYINLFMIFGVIVYDYLIECMNVFLSKYNYI